MVLSPEEVEKDTHDTPSGLGAVCPDDKKPDTPVSRIGF
jgi:hypothetical protein